MPMRRPTVSPYVLRSVLEAAKAGRRSKSGIRFRTSGYLNYPPLVPEKA